MLSFRGLLSLPGPMPTASADQCGSILPSCDFPKAVGTDKPVRTKTGGPNFSGIHSPPLHPPPLEQPLFLSDPGGWLLEKGRESWLCHPGGPLQGVSRARSDPSGRSQTGFPSLGVGFVTEPPPPRCVLACKSHSCLVLMTLNT